MASFVKIVCFLVNYAIFHELCDRMRFAVDCAKSHHRVISEGLPMVTYFVTKMITYNVFANNWAGF